MARMKFGKARSKRRNSPNSSGLYIRRIANAQGIVLIPGVVVRVPYRAKGIRY